VSGRQAIEEGTAREAPIQDVQRGHTGRDIAPIRSTSTRCPVCVRRVTGTIEEIDAKVYLCRSCPEHGPFQFLLSANAQLYRDLDRFYFEVLKTTDQPQGRITNYWVLSTNRCQLNCAFCQAEVEAPVFDDMSADEFRALFASHGTTKLTLSGGEPTLHPQAAAFFAEAHARGMSTQLATNGVRLAQRDYCRTLAAAKVSEVRISIESLDDRRVPGLYDDAFYPLKLEALKNLEAFGITTILSPTIFKGVNESLLIDALEFAKDRPFIKEISANGFSWVGEGRGMDAGLMIMPDEMMDLLHRRYCSSGREEIFTLQKALLTALQMMRIRLCLYTQVMIFVRERRGLAPITDYLDMTRLAAGIRTWERFARSPYPLQLVAFLGACLSSLRWRSLKLAGPLARLFLATAFGINIHRYPSKLLAVVLNTNCSTLNADEMVGTQCMSGVLYKQNGAMLEAVSSEMLLRKEAAHAKQPIQRSRRG